MSGCRSTNCARFCSAVSLRDSESVTDGGPDEFLTHADGCDDRGGDYGQGHASCDGQVPSVTRRLLQLVVGVDLERREEKKTERDD